MNTVMKNLKLGRTTLFALYFSVMGLGTAFAHTVTVMWCVDPSGQNMRIWHEHWHGDITTINATLDLSITVNGGAPIVLNAVKPTGAIINTPQANLPCKTGCGSVGQNIIKTTDRSGNYGDWAYWDVNLNETGICDNDNPTVSVSVTQSNPSSAIFWNYQGTVPSTAASNITLPDCPAQISCPDAVIELGCLSSKAVFNSLVLPEPTETTGADIIISNVTDSVTTRVNCRDQFTRTWDIYKPGDVCDPAPTYIQSCSSIFRYEINTDAPVITQVHAPDAYGCLGDIRPLSQSMAAVMTSDDDNNIDSINLFSETRTTNDCLVEVTRNWFVSDCCVDSGTVPETYTFLINTTTIKDTTLDTLNAGCITDLSMLPAPTATEVGTEPSCGDLAITFVGTEPYKGDLTACEKAIVRVYNVSTSCDDGLVRQPIIYSDDSGDPVITAVLPYVDYACSGDVRSIADSLAGMTTSDPDGDDTVITTNLFSELQITNECSVMVTRTWEVFDCCSNRATATEMYSYLIPMQSIMNPQPASLDVGCVPSQDLIPPPDFIAAGTMASCGQLKITPLDVYVLPLPAPTPCPKGTGCTCLAPFAPRSELYRVYQIETPCETVVVTQTVTFTINTAPPVISATLPFQDYGCAGDVRSEADSLAGLVYSDVDGNDSIICADIVNTVRVTNDCSVTVTRYWTVVDWCGLSDEVAETYAYDLTPTAIMNDTLPALALGCIDDVSQIPPPDFIAAGTMASCGALKITFVSSTPLTGLLACQSGIERTYEVGAACTTSMVKQTVTYMLNPGPIVITNVPPDMDLGCQAVGFNPPDPTKDETQSVIDSNLGSFTNVVHVDTILDFECGKKLIRTWVATGCCGNIGTKDQIITWTTIGAAPAIVCPPSVNVGCIQHVNQLPAPNPDAATATVSCGDATVIWVADSVPFAGKTTCDWQVRRSYAVIDACGQSNLCAQILSYILDTGDPMITAVSNFVDYGCQPSDPRTLAESMSAITSMDDSAVLSTTLVAQVEMEHGCKVTITRTWKIEDCCGNLATRDETYCYTKQPTVFNVDALADLDLNCIDAMDDIPQPNTTIVDATSDCSVVQITWLSDVAVTSLKGGCYTAIDRTYQVEDLCGSTLSVVQRIDFILDTATPRIVSVLPSMDFGCVDADPRSLAVSLAGVIATDADNHLVSTSLVQEVRSTNDCVVSVTRTWRVEDCCTKFDILDETYSYTERPAKLTVEALGDIFVGCVASTNQLPQPNTTMIDANSECSIADIDFVRTENLVDGVCTDSVDYVYSVTDLCGDTVEITQAVIWVLNELPKITSIETGMDFSCQAPSFVPPTNLTAFAGEHIFVGPTISEMAITNGCAVEFIRTYTIENCCGFTDEAEVRFTYTETPVAPGAGPLPDYFVGCIAHTNQIPQPNTTLLAVMSSCPDASSIFLNHENPQTVGCTSFLDRVYQVTDVCGQTATTTQTISWVLNTLDPEITAIPEGSDLGCVAAGYDFLANNPPLTNSVTVVDDNVVSIDWMGDVTVTSGCDVTVTRTWQAIDCCDQIDQKQTVYQYRLQGTGPVLTCPAALDLGCIADVDQVPSPSSLLPAASSACGDAVVAWMGDGAAAQNGCDWSFVRTYMATDECGLSVSCTQTISYRLDAADPVIVSVSNFVDYGCVTADPRPVLVSSNALVTSDDSLVVSTQLVNETTMIHDCKVTVTRTWQVTDCCGNTTTRDETYCYYNTPGPLTVAALADVDLRCIDTMGDIPQPNTTIVAATSDCSVVSVSWLRDDTVTSDKGGCYEAIDRVFQIEDLCGGMLDVTQRVDFILDAMPPTITSVPAYQDYGCVAADPRPSSASLPLILASDPENHLVSTTLVAEVSITNDCKVTGTRTWRVEDCCGRFDLANEVYEYTVTPSALTVAALAPLDLGCIADVNQVPLPNTTLVSAQSDCSVQDITFVSDSAPVTIGCISSIERIYMITDLCGGVASVTQDISWVLNTLDPMVTDAGLGQDFGCQVIGWTILAPTLGDTNAVQVTDDNVISVEWVGDVYATNGCDVTVTRTWEATDCCGNSDRGDQVFSYTARDANPPVVTALCPDDIALGCIAAMGQIPDPVATLGIASSACDVVVTHLSDSAHITNGCLVTFTRTNIATDVCGQQTTCDFTITYLLDNANPMIVSVPPFVDNGCNGDPRPIPLTNQVVSMDDYLVTSTEMVSEVRTTNGCVVEVTRNWKITDCCGNFDEAVETYQFTINPTDPILTAARALDLACIDAMDDIPAPSLTITNVSSECGMADVAFVSDVAVVSEKGGCYEAIDRTYSITDLCGDSGTITQRIHYILDREPPRIVSVAPFINATCSADPRPIPLTNMVVATDAENHLVSTQLVSELRLTNDCQVTVTRTWRVEDCCGGFDIADEVYQFTVTPDPVSVSALAPLDLGCIQDVNQVPLPDTTLLAAQSSCAVVDLAFITQYVVSNDVCTTYMERVYQATDLCGQTAVVTQNISYILNLEDPIILDAGASADFGCQVMDWAIPAPTAAETNAVATADDNITNVSWVGDAYVTNGCDVTVTRTWEITDCCGNLDQATVLYFYNVIPPAPSIVDLCPANIDLGCIDTLGDIPTAIATLGSSSGGCDIQVSHLGDGVAVKALDNCTWSFARTNIAEDTCGMVSTCSFTISYILDAEIPEIVVPQQLHYGCLVGDPRSVSVVSNGIVTASIDPDGNAFVISLDAEIRLTNDCEITVTRTWKITDCCGNVDHADEVYQYTVAPSALVVDALAPINLGCINNVGQIPSPNTTLISASSSCAVASIIWLSDTAAANVGCTWSFTRTYQVTDKCGLVRTTSQLISYTLDQNDPVIVTQPAGGDLGCQVTAPWPVPVPNAMTDITVSDDSFVTNQVVVETISTNGCVVTVTHDYTITDCCGRQDEAQTVYTFTIKPDSLTIEALADIDLGCLTSTNLVPQPNATLINASSSCSVASIEFVSDTPTNLTFCTDGLDRIYQVTDLCGLTSTVTQRYTWILNQVADPMITVPADFDFGCVAQGWTVPLPTAADTNAVIGMDDNLVSTQWIGDVYSTNDCVVSVVRTWRVTDCCESKAEASTTYTFTENPGPPAITCPLPLDLGCINNLAAIPVADPSLVAASSGCSGVNVTFLNETAATLNGCVWSFTRTYLATARCGETSTCTQVITYTLDQNDPVILTQPAGGDLGCQDLAPWPVPFPNALTDITVSDDSSVTNQVVVETITSNGCVVTVTHDYTITDCCGRQDEAQTVYTFTVRPTELLLEPLSDIDLGCLTSTNQVPLPDTSLVGASSVCSVASVAFVNDTPTNLTTCLDGLDRVYLVTDLCGLTATVTQRFTWVLNEMSPMITNTPSDVDFGCVAPTFALPAPTVADFAAIQYMDDNVITTQHVGDVYTTNDCLVTVVRTWRVIDCCGGKADATTTYVWTRNPGPPVMTCPPQQDLGCINDLGAIPLADVSLVSTVSECSGVVVTLLSETTATNAGCVWSFTRTYLATARCGETSTCTQVITYTLDQNDPVIVSQPAGGDLGCQDLAPWPVPAPNAMTDITVSDDSSVTNQVVVETITTNGCVVTVTHDYTITDCCGRQDEAQTVYTFTVRPSELSIAALADVNLECITSTNQVPLPDTSLLIASSECSIASAVFVSDTATNLSTCVDGLDRVYLVTDLCGLTATVTQRFTWILNQMDPMITAVPADEYLGCKPKPPEFPPNAPGWILPAPTTNDFAQIIVMDDNAITTQWVGDVYTTNDCIITVVRTWRVIDCCGKKAEAESVYTWTQNPGPPILTCPPALDLGCIRAVSQIPLADPSLVSAIEYCGETEITWLSDSPAVQNGCTWSFIRTYHGETVCGETGICTQAISYTLDNAPPTILSWPSYTHSECVDGDPYPVPRTNEIVTADDSLVVATNMIYEIRFTNDCYATVQRIFEATDCCNNIRQTTVLYTYRVRPAAPTLTGPTQIDLECIFGLGQVPSPSTSSLTAQSDCSGVSKAWVSDSTPVTNDCTVSILRTYEATDTCGQTTPFTQTITFTPDNADPVFTSFPSGEAFGCVAVEPTLPIATNHVIASDDFLVIRTQLVNDVRIDTDCLITVTRTWEIEDCCNNIVTRDVVYTWVPQDANPPSITCPATLDLGCIQSLSQVPAANPSALASSSACADNLSVIHLGDSAPATNGCTLTILRGFSVTDLCGQTSSCTQTIVFTVDALQPVFTAFPTNIDFGCSAGIPAPSVADDFAVIASADDSQIIRTELIEATTNTVNCLTTVIRSYEIEDCCGNRQSESVTYTWITNLGTPPVFAAGQSSTLDLGCVNTLAQVPAASPDSFPASAGCDVTLSLLMETPVEINGCVVKFRRIYQAIDVCGNMAQHFQTILYTVDTTDPVFTAFPTNIDFGCAVGLPAPTVTDDFAAIQTADESIVVRTELLSAVTNVVDCEASVTRTYEIEDCCGNQVSDSVTYTWYQNPNQAPVFAAGNSSTLDLRCIDSAAEVPAASPDSFPASSSCAVSVTHLSDTSPVTNGCVVTVIRTYQAMDACGNAGQHVQTILFTSDRNAPIFTQVPVGAEFGCQVSSPVPAVDLSLVTAMDDNLVIDVRLKSESIVSNGCARSLLRTWIAEDCCGESVEASTTYTWTQTPASPVIQGLASVDLGCIADAGQLPLPSTSQLVIDAACGATPAYVGVVSSKLDGCTTIDFRVYEAVDACGQRSTFTQTISYVINANPIQISAALPAKEYGCVTSMPVPAADFGLLTVSGTVLNQTVVDTLSTNGCVLVLTRIYTVADCCGNVDSVSEQHTWTLQGDGPSISQMPDLALGCLSDASQVPGPNPALVEASSDCSLASVLFVADQPVSADVCASEIDRVYEVTDGCGQTAVVTQRISWSVDTDLPVITAMPSGGNLGCNVGALPLVDLSQVQAEDSCGIASIIHLLDKTNVVDCLTVVTRTFRVTDLCGNDLDADVIYSWSSDATAPLITAPAGFQADIELGCNPSVTAFPPVDPTQFSVEDDCGQVEVTFAYEQSETNQCVTTLSRVYSASDACGNASSVTQSFRFFVDTSAPQPAIVPADLNLGCATASDVPAPDAAVFNIVDMCGTAVETNLVEETANNSGCQVVITRTYEVTDICGNTGRAVQAIRYTDNQGDLALSCPGPMDLGCNPAQIPTPSETSPAALGGCDATSVQHLGDTKVINQCVTTIARRYSITDACGNTATCTIDIRYSLDAQVPTIVSLPSSGAIGCNLALPEPDPSLIVATDDCGEPSVTVLRVTTNQSDCVMSVAHVYRVSDSCGNFQDVEMFYSSIQDLTAPVLTCAETISLELNSECRAVMPSLAPQSLIDDCGTSRLISQTPAEGTVFTSPGLITATLVAEDDCGRTVSCTSVIMINGICGGASGDNLGSIEGVVWHDLSNNGEEGDENLSTSGMSGIRVFLYDEDGNEVAETITTAGGFYEFPGLVPGDYTVEVDLSSIDTDIYNMPPSTPLVYDVSVVAGGVGAGNDFGLVAGPTAITLLSLQADISDVGVTVRWEMADQDDLLGFYLTRDGLPVSDLILAGDARRYEFLDEENVSGTYTLESIGNSLIREVLGATVAARLAEAEPIGDPTLRLRAIAGQLNFVTEDGVNSYLVTGFSKAPVVTDITDADDAIRLEGRVIELDHEFGVYFSWPANRKLQLTE